MGYHIGKRKTNQKKVHSSKFMLQSVNQKMMFWWSDHPNLTYLHLCLVRRLIETAAISWNSSSVYISLYSASYCIVIGILKVCGCAFPDEKPGLLSRGKAGIFFSFHFFCGVLSHTELRPQLSSKGAGSLSSSMPKRWKCGRKSAPADNRGRIVKLLHYLIHKCVSFTCLCHWLDEIIE